MNIIEKLKQFKVEITPEMEKTFSGNFLSELEVDKKLSKAENERDIWKQKAEALWSQIGKVSDTCDEDIIRAGK